MKAANLARSASNPVCAQTLQSGVHHPTVGSLPAGRGRVERKPELAALTGPRSASVAGRHAGVAVGDGAAGGELGVLDGLGDAGVGTVGVADFGLTISLAALPFFHFFQDICQ